MIYPKSKKLILQEKNWEARKHPKLIPIRKFALVSKLLFDQRTVWLEHYYAFSVFYRYEGLWVKDYYRKSINFLTLAEGYEKFPHSQRLIDGKYYDVEETPENKELLDKSAMLSLMYSI